MVLAAFFFAAGLTMCFLLCLVTFLAVAAGAAWPLAGGVAGDCANVRGMVATARAIVSKVVFIFFFLLRALAARSQFHNAANAPGTR